MRPFFDAWQFWQPPKMAELAERIEKRARQGATVQLTPETALAGAAALRAHTDGHPSLRDSHPHHVEDWSQDPHEVLAYCTSATLAIGAWEAYAPQRPGRAVIATWGGWITRGQKRA